MSDSKLIRIQALYIILIAITLLSPIIMYVSMYEGVIFWNTLLFWIINFIITCSISQENIELKVFANFFLFFLLYFMISYLITHIVIGGINKAIHNITYLLIISQIAMFYINFSSKKILHLIPLILFVSITNEILYKLKVEGDYYEFLVHLILFINSIFSFLAFRKQYLVKNEYE